MNKKSGQEFKFLVNEKSFYSEIKSIFDHNKQNKTIFEQTKQFFLEDENSTLGK